MLVVIVDDDAFNANLCAKIVSSNAAQAWSR